VRATGEGLDAALMYGSFAAGEAALGRVHARGELSSRNRATGRTLFWEMEYSISWVNRCRF